MGEERLELALARPSSASSRWLLVLRERLAALRLPAAVTGAVLAVADAAPAPVEQLSIGDRPAQLAALDAVLARLAARLGDDAFFAAEAADRHRPEAAFRRAPFAAGAPSKVERERGPAPAPRRRRTQAGPKEDAFPAEPPSAPVRPLRLLQPPEPIVALGEGGRIAALRIRGRALRLLELSPPERLTGEWWWEPFARDYRRARLEGLGDCWIFRDAADGRLWLHGFFD
jgi:protein ImuB